MRARSAQEKPSMRVIIDEALFDRRQAALLGELVQLVKDAVHASDMSEGTKQLFIETLLFNVTCVIDGSQVMELDGEPLVPRLTFANERDGDAVVSCGGGSFMHEYVMGYLAGV
jgi:hypothetical protein